VAFGKKLNVFQKSVKAGGEVLLDLYYEKSCFWAKTLVAFGPFGWLLAFTKAKAGPKAQPKGSLVGGFRSDEGKPRK